MKYKRSLQGAVLVYRYTHFKMATGKRFFQEKKNVRTILKLSRFQPTFLLLLDIYITGMLDSRISLVRLHLGIMSVCFLILIHQISQHSIKKTF